MARSERPGDEGLVLVTGAAGFIGQHLLSRLESLGANVRGIGRGVADLSVASAVDSLFSSLRPAKVVHLAASLNRMDDRSAQREQWRDTYTTGRLIAEAAASHGVQHVIAAGTLDEVGRYSGIVGPDATEAPTSAYGFAKVAVRHALDANAHSAYRVDWFRPFVVYGPGQRGPMLVPAAFAAACASRREEFSDGHQQRDFLFVEDLVDWLVGGVLHGVRPDEIGRLEIHHVGTGLATPVADVLARVGTHFPGARFVLGARPRRADEPDVQIAPRSMTAPWHWSATTSLDDGIRKTAAWWREHCAGDG